MESNLQYVLDYSSLKKNSLLKSQTERLTSGFTTTFGAKRGENNVEVKIKIEDGSLALWMLDVVKLQRNRNIPD